MRYCLHVLRREFLVNGWVPIELWKNSHPKLWILLHYDSRNEERPYNHQFFILRGSRSNLTSPFRIYSSLSNSQWEVVRVIPNLFHLLRKIACCPQLSVSQRKKFCPQTDINSFLKSCCKFNTCKDKSPCRCWSRLWRRRRYIIPIISIVR